MHGQQLALGSQLAARFGPGAGGTRLLRPRIEKITIERNDHFGRCKVPVRLQLLAERLLCTGV